MRSTLRPVVLLIAAVVAFAPFSPSEAKKDKKRRAEDVINFALGVEYAQWLNSPIYFMVSDAERAGYLRLTSDEEAQAFIDEFWKRLDPDPGFFGNGIKDLYDERLSVADRRFRETVRTGRRTDRGVIFVLHGEPDRIEFFGGTNPREPDLEVWNYSKGAEPGLSGEKPESRYYFAEQDGEVVRYQPRPSQLRSLRQQRN